MTGVRVVLSGVEGGNDTTRSATQVGLRGHESGLGAHDDGASGVDEGVEKVPIPLWKRGRLAMSDSATFSGFEPPGKDIFSEDQNTKSITIELCCIHGMGCQES